MNGPGLLALQQIDHELDQLAAQAKRLPARATLAAAEDAHRAWAAERAAQVAAAERAGEAITRAEHDASQLDTKRASLEAKLKTIIAPREAEALMNEIATVKAQRDTIDDAELQAMEEQSEAEAAIELLDGREPDLHEAITAARAVLDGELATIGDGLDAWRAKRADAVAALSADELAFYDQLRTRHGGVGIVHLEGGHRCSGCHLDLTPAEVDEVKSAPAGELPECPHCGRLIVR